MPTTKKLLFLWLLVALCAGVGVLIVFAQSTTMALPLGDGKISTSPQHGYVFACPLPSPGPGASRVGMWIHDGLWFPDQKVAVSGNVLWTNSSLELSIEAEKRVIRANNLPNHVTGIFPIEPSDEAYQYDQNPNAIREQTIVLTLPAVPEIADSPSCLPLGMIGFALTGGAIYHAVDLQRRDAPAYEIQDGCNGHPEMRGQYHYHNYSLCMNGENASIRQHSELVGYALDGFGIYGLHGEDGSLLSNEDLDECHGHTHLLEWDGETREMYHYHFTLHYPYSLGCFKGESSSQ